MKEENKGKETKERHRETSLLAGFQETMMKRHKNCNKLKATAEIIQVLLKFERTLRKMLEI